MSLFLVIVLFSARSLSAPDTGSAFAGFELVQFHKDRGEIIVDLCQNGVKLYTRLSDTVTLSTAPGWRVVTYSNRTKKIYTTDLKKFQGEDRVIFTLSGVPQFNIIPVTSAGTGTVAGLPVRNWKSFPNFHQSQMKAYYARAMPGNNPCEIDYSISTQLALKPQLSELMTRYYQFPKVPGIPIQLMYDSIDRHRVTLFTTHKCRPKTFTSNDFKPPASFQAVKSLAEVQADITDQNEAESLIQTFDLRRLGTHH
jgi:hypothetical protein